MNTPRRIEPLPPSRLDETSEKMLSARFENAWSMNEMLFSSVEKEETFYHQPNPLRHPLIFYRGHTAAFYDMKFRMAGLIAKNIRKDMVKLFAVGVDPKTPKEMPKPESWPAMKEITRYRGEIRNMVRDVIADSASDKPITWDDPRWAILMGIEHELIHFETSGMLLQRTPVEALRRPDGWEYAPANLSEPDVPNVPKKEPIHIPAGEARLGKNRNDEYYGWDNEYGDSRVAVDEFLVDNHLITNADFREFVDADGYERDEFWQGEALEWKKQIGREHPMFWVPDGKGDFGHRVMFNIQAKLPLDWPVEVNKYEAEAYLKWKGQGARLMTEAEHRQAASFNGGVKNLNMRFGSPAPVTMVDNSYGNVWQWLSDDWNLFAGFKKHGLYPNFSPKHKADEQAMVAGGAFNTSGTAALPHYRLWMRPHDYQQNAGFRIARSIK